MSLLEKLKSSIDRGTFDYPLFNSSLSFWSFFPLSCCYVDISKHPIWRHSSAFSTNLPIQVKSMLSWWENLFSLSLRSPWLFHLEFHRWFSLLSCVFVAAFDDRHQCRNFLHRTFHSKVTQSLVPIRTSPLSLLIQSSKGCSQCSRAKDVSHFQTIPRDQPRSETGQFVTSSVPSSSFVLFLEKSLRIIPGWSNRLDNCSLSNI